MPQLPATVAIIITAVVVYVQFAIVVVVITAVIIIPVVVVVITVVVAAAVDVDVTLCTSLLRQRKPKTLNHVGSDFCLLFYYHTHVHILMY